PAAPAPADRRGAEREVVPVPGEPGAHVPEAPAVPALPVPPAVPAEPVPPAPPVWASAKPPPHARAAAAARVRILEVCLMHISCCVMSVDADRQDAEVSTLMFGNRCAAEETVAAVLSANPYTRCCASPPRAASAPSSSFPPECRQR